jgi:hypothetical protein
VNIIYTYFEGRPGGESDGDLIRLWAESWRRYGWTPRILTPTYIRRHKLFKQTAPQDRWRLALKATGGGWFSKFDVMNAGLRPGSTPRKRMLGRVCSLAVDNSVVFMGRSGKWDDKCDVWAGYCSLVGGKNWELFPLVRFSKSAVFSTFGEGVAKHQAAASCGNLF